MRFLFLYTHQTWPMHYFQAGIMARALINEGHEVVWLNCDRTMSGCHVHWILPNIDPVKICETCVSRTGWIESMGIKPVSFLEFLTREDVEAAMEPLGAKDLAQLSAWDDCGTPVGKLALSSPASASRTISLGDPADALFETYPVAVSSAIIVNRAVKRLLGSVKIDRAVFHLGRLVPDAVSKHLMSERGIPWYCYESGPLTGTLRLTKNETIYDYDFYTRSWWQLCDQSLNNSQKFKVSNYLLSRRGDPEKTGLFTYSPTSQDGSDIYTLLNINRSQKIVSFFTSSIDEFAYYPSQGEFNQIYDDQQDAISELLAWVNDKSEYTLVIRIHPNEGRKRNHLGMPGQKSIELLAPILGHPDVPKNVRVVWPDDEVSSYLIGDASAAVVVWQSTIGMEFAAFSKPVILLDNAVYREADFCYVPSRKGDLGALIATAESCSSKEINARSERAQAWVYHQDFRMSIDFPLVIDHGRWERVSLAFDDPSTIRASEYDHIGRIVSFLASDVCPYHD